MKRMLVIFGTRPEAIKMAPLIRELHRYPQSFRTQVCITAQHREMLDQVLRLFAIHPDYDLDSMTPGQDLASLTALLLTRLRTVLDEARPDMVLVHGDTTTTMAASLAAYYAGIPVAHVEAGLRTGNKRAPFPEEINRRIAGCIADLHFAPTPLAREHLIGEGVREDTIFVTGNTVVDALQMIMQMIDRPGAESAIIAGLTGTCPGLGSVLGERPPGSGSRMLLVTGHRREQFGGGFEQMCQALKEIAGMRKDVVIVYPVHLNPKVQEPARKILGSVPNVLLLEPVDYLQFTYLMRRAYLILTDSGGVQEEAPALGKPVLVMREATERPEALLGGTALLVGMERREIVEGALRLLDDPLLHQTMSRAHNPFGDGHAAQRIAEILAK